MINVCVLFTCIILRGTHLFESVDNLLALREVSDEQFQCLGRERSVGAHGQQDEHSQQLAALLRVKSHVHHPTFGRDRERREFSYIFLVMFEKG